GTPGRRPGARTPPGIPPRRWSAAAKGVPMVMEGPAAAAVAPAEPGPADLAPPQRREISRQIGLSEHLGAVGQHRDHPHSGTERRHQLPPDPPATVGPATVNAAAAAIPTAGEPDVAAGHAS